MAEIKNTFIKSKMNKDLDDRLLTNGEYRNAQNVNVSRSEGDDVGSLENVRGNKVVSNLINIGSFGAEVIGFFEDDTNKCVYTFLTNYTDPLINGLETPAPFTTGCFIVKTDLTNPNPQFTYLNSQVLVNGSFLNFSATHPIYGVNLIEDLLFFTDNRNQPRKINVKLAVSTVNQNFQEPYPGTYYTNEDQISVAKYYPCNTPKVYDQVGVTIKSTSGPDPVTGDYKNFVSEADSLKLKGGMMVLHGSQSFTVSSGNEKFVITSFTGDDITSYFLSDKKIIGSIETNKVVYFGFGTAINVSDEYIDYSITGSIFREDTAVCPQIGPLKLQTLELPVQPNSFRIQSTLGSLPLGTYTNVSYSIGNAASYFLNAIIDIEIMTPPVTGMPGVKVTVTFGGGMENSGSNVGFQATTEIVITAADIIPGSTAGGQLTWNLIQDDLACIQPPTAKTFYWSGSSIPYTKMKVDVPGYLSDGGISQTNTITDVRFIGSFTAAPATQDNYYLITTQFDHNIGVPNPNIVNAVAIAEFSWPNPEYLQNAGEGAFPGDPEYLKNRFVRFAYRFKFDDGEYSLISPFTQPVFIPKQRGFIQDGVSLVSTAQSGQALSGNVTSSNFQRYATGEEDIQASTIVSFFENNIDTVRLQIEMPSRVSELNVSMKIKELDIIYKESDAQDMKILDTIPYEVFKYTDAEQTILNASNLFEYLYESKEPFKLVKPAGEILRVYDKVPVKAFAQETSGGRIIYGNFLDKHTPPSDLKFNVRITEKAEPVAKNPIVGGSGVPSRFDGIVNSNSYLSYPTHTLKQNRSYQVGFVLSDRYGRQSDVILAPVDTGQYYIGTTVYNGGTVFNPYFLQSGNTPWGIVRDGQENFATWKGQNLEVLLREAIPETVTYADGYPGLYNSGEYIMNVPTAQSATTAPQVVTFTSVDPRIKPGDFFEDANTNTQHLIIAISGNDVTINGSVDVFPNTTLPSGQFLNRTGFITGSANNLGWYSYKIVVKQLTEDYYNAYLGNLSYLSPSSALSTTTGNYPFSGSSFVTSLLSDNSSKIAADLTKVAPEQLQFGTSDTLLYPRVGGTQLNDGIPVSQPYIYAVNFSFGTDTASINAYGKIKDIGVAELNTSQDAFLTPTQSRGVQGAASDPQAIIVTMPEGQQIGREFWRDTGLYVLEVGALESKIEIFWETSTSGLISDLNASVLKGPDAVLSVPSPNPVPVPPIEKQLNP